VALKGGTRFAVRFEDVFPSGCVMGADTIVSKVVDFDKRVLRDVDLPTSGDRRVPDEGAAPRPPRAGLGRAVARGAGPGSERGGSR